ncbi:hypothetical protein OG369_14660 [Streptomyces sp. NBC_01221]|uniref:hypothetical protein n=1 Tax=unclassified Streptomyces TaxID=2593676 RepID=UPI0022588682|nr:MULTISPECIES: hypothetical protein [unclassified Streptomyces]MCX4787380.1 hypothetical protein [Streptomyces sp. NBC_01221]MCX4796835.1 hypothetical protein [Streptomyces sp. NBC_01242]
MGDPDLKVITDGLRSDAVMWDEQSGAMKAVHNAVEGTRMNHLQAGVFQLIVSAYESVIDQISARSTEGEVQMATVATALYKNAKAYDDHEVDTKKHVDHAY